MFVDLPPVEPSIEIVVASEGISKGLQQTDDPQLLVTGRLDIGNAYVGAYAKNIDGSAGGETQAFVGYRFEVIGFDVDARAGYKVLVDPNPNVDDQAIETQVSIQRGLLGPVSAKATVTYSPDDVGSTGESLYVEGGLQARLDRFTLSGNVGRRERENGGDYTAFNAGVAYKVNDNITLEARYYSTDSGSLGETYRDRVVGAVRFRF